MAKKDVLTTEEQARYDEQQRADAEAAALPQPAGTVAPSLTPPADLQQTSDQQAQLIAVQRAVTEQRKAIDHVPPPIAPFEPKLPAPVDSSRPAMPLVPRAENRSGETQLPQGAREAIIRDPKILLSDDDRGVLMNFPKTVRLTLDDHRSVEFRAGTRRVPTALKDHWYLRANAVEVQEEDH